MKITTEQKLYAELMKTYMDNTKPWGDVSAIREVTKAFRVFKKTQKTIVALEIPVGALVHFDDNITEVQFDRRSSDRKMRCDKARVIQQISYSSIINDNGVYVLSDAKESLASESKYTSGFPYHTDQIVTPANGFHKRRGTCEAGVHFYLNLSDALNHS